MSTNKKMIVTALSACFASYGIFCLSCIIKKFSIKIALQKILDAIHTGDMDEVDKLTDLLMRYEYICSIRIDYHKKSMEKYRRTKKKKIQAVVKRIFDNHQLCQGSIAIRYSI